MRSLVIAGAMCASALASCGGPGQDEVSSSTTATTKEVSEEAPDTSGSVPATSLVTTTTAATTTTVPIDYGRQYLDLVVESNCELDEFRTRADEISARPAADQWQFVQADLLPQAKVVSDALIRLYEGLIRAPWPPEVAEDIEKMAVEASDEASFFANLASTDELSSFVALTQDYEGSGNTASIVRAKLGLESNIGSEDLCGVQ